MPSLARVLARVMAGTVSGPAGNAERKCGMRTRKVNTDIIGLIHESTFRC